jgi:all-trans-retinol 13,14-reductase
MRIVYIHQRGILYIQDPSYAARYPGKSTCTVVTEAPFRLFEEWKDGKVRHRGDEYDAVKENIKEQILEYVR